MRFKTPKGTTLRFDDLPIQSEWPTYIEKQVRVFTEYYFGGDKEIWYFNRAFNAELSYEDLGKGNKEESDWAEHALANAMYKYSSTKRTMMVSAPQWYGTY
jgi:hypothetical protein